MSVFDNSKIGDLSWKKKPAHFVSSRDQLMLFFGG